MQREPRNRSAARAGSVAVLGVACLFLVAGAGAQESRRARPDRPRSVSPTGLPDLTTSSRMELSMPQEGAGRPILLKVQRQDPDGQFSGLLLQPEGQPVEAAVQGRVSRTATGGFKVAFTCELGAETAWSFEGALSLSRARGAEPGRLHLAGVYTLQERGQPAEGPYPFSGSGPRDRSPAPPDRPEAPPAPEPAPRPAPETPAPEPAPGTRPEPPPVRPSDGSLRNGRPYSDSLRRNRIVIRDSARIQADLWGMMERQGNLTTFLRLAQAAGQEEYFRKGKITLLVPDDAAFARLPAGRVDRLLQPENRRDLMRYVNYCIMYGGKYLTIPDGKAGAQPFPAERIETRTASMGVSWEGNRMWLRGNDGKRAEVIKRDIDCGNGALFVTNVVLFPSFVRFD